MATAATLSLLPSSFGINTLDRSNSYPSTTSFPSSSSSVFFNGGTYLNSRKPYPSVLISSRKRNGRALRFGTFVVKASADYYATLGVPKSATVKEIKAAYRKLARQVIFEHCLWQKSQLVVYQVNLV